MLRVILLALLSFLIVRALRTLLRSVMTGAVAGGPQRSRPTPPMKLVRDPVCGTHVAPRTALSLLSGGATHYFCSPECRDKYRSAH